MKRLKDVLNENTYVLLVTHGELCHTDDVMSTALLGLLCDFYKKPYQIYRTRDEAIVKTLNNAIVYDVFGGELDHHNIVENEIDGRRLSSIGKIWRWAKPEILEAFELTESSWRDVDKQFIKGIDITDNTGIMNPFSCVVNSKRSIYLKKNPNDFNGAFTYCLGFCKECLEGVLISLADKGQDEIRFGRLPVVKFKNLLFKYNEGDYITPPPRFPGVFGYIFIKPNGNYGVRALNGNSLKIFQKGSEPEGVVFTHQTGFTGEIISLDYIEKII